MPLYRKGVTGSERHRKDFNEQKQGERIMKERVSKRQKMVLASHLNSRRLFVAEKEEIGRDLYTRIKKLSEYRNIIRI